MAIKAESISDSRRRMREAQQRLVSSGQKTHCLERPVPFTEVRQSADQAAALCHRGLPTECPILKICESFGSTESIYADDIVYGGYSWRRGKRVKKDP